MPNLEAFQKNIEALRGAIPELRAILIGSTEGLPVAHWIAGGADPARVAAMAERISAMAAALAARTERARFLNILATGGLATCGAMMKREPPKPFAIRS